MPRTPSIKPKHREERVKKGLAAWCVNVPPQLGENGKRQQLFFVTKEEAKTECERLKARKANFGVSLGNLTSSQIVEAARCYRLLSDHPGVSLSDAVRGYLEVHHARNASVPLSELFDKFLESKSKRTKKYLDQIRWARDHFESLHRKLASDITSRDLESVLSGLKPSVRNAFRRYVRAVFNYGFRLDYVRENPAMKIEAEELVRGETEIFHRKRVEKMLARALERDLTLLPYRVFTFFCGIRPEGEMERLEWSHVSLSDRVVDLPAEITKKKRRRTVDLSENAVAWLQEYTNRGGKMVGRVVPFTPSELRKHHRANYKAAGVRKWIQQGARHSFCSYWLAHNNNDVDRLVILSGHESKEVMWNSYYRAASKAEAAKFWSIIPPKKPDAKVIPFAA
jgi:integrase